LEQWLQEGLPAWFQSHLLPVTKVIADRWARVTIEAKRRGIAVAMADGLIAATALEHDLILVTRNVRDFADLSVPIFSPWTDRS
jgi:predicted nucleic acid-binding protein